MQLNGKDEHQVLSLLFLNLNPVYTTTHLICLEVILVCQSTFYYHHPRHDIIDELCMIFLYINTYYNILDLVKNRSRLLYKYSQVATHNQFVLSCDIIQRIIMWLLGFNGPSGFSARSTAEHVTQGIDGTGLTAIVTGPSFLY